MCTFEDTPYYIKYENEGEYDDNKPKTGEGGPVTTGAIADNIERADVELESPLAAGAGAFFETLWDTFKLYDEDDVRTNFNNLAESGYSSTGLGGIWTYHLALTAAIGESIGVGRIEDARSGRDIANESLSGTQRAWRGVTGLAIVSLEAIGLKGVGGAARRGLKSLSDFGTKLKGYFSDGAVVKAPKVKTNGHHSDPKFLGGDPKQKTTTVTEPGHKQLHKDLNDHLRTKTDAAGNHMRPQRGNSGAKIRDNFTRQERLEATAEFYKNNLDKYPDSARDFFRQHPGLE